MSKIMEFHYFEILLITIGFMIMMCLCVLGRSYLLSVKLFCIPTKAFE